MSADGPSGRPIAFHAEDGEALQGVIFESGTPCAGSVLVAGGMGIPQRFYTPFASWLAARGYRVLTFDLRGMGASRRPEHQKSLRGLNADMLTWARQDFAAAVKTLANSAGDRRIALVGHSLGIHHAAMADAATQGRISVAVSVAAGSGYWRDWAQASRRKAPWMLHLASPLLTPLFGYFPGKALRMVGDLPGPAMRQWTAWCRHPAFAWGAEPDRVLPSLKSASFRIEAYSFSDDEAMTKACTRKLLDAMPNAKSVLHVLTPGDVGLRAIGHVGAFRREASSALWPLFAASLGKANGSQP
jgi:predicted alpha/beta hydrolase